MGIRRRLMLSPQEKSELHLALRQALDPEDLKVLAEFVFGKPLYEIVDGEKHSSRVMALIVKADNGQFVKELIEKALTINQDDNLLNVTGKQILERLLDEDRYVPQNHYETCLVVNQQAFINRKDLRRFLRQL